MDKQAAPVTQTKQGNIEGSFENGLFIFRGIPYAAPPAGEWRWMPPQPVKPWNGIRSALQFGPIAPQNSPPPGIMGEREPEPQNEDCLYLNVYSPGLDDKKRPVMVWIHGGAFSIGSGSTPTYQGEALAKNGDIVLVSFNYRLGLLGFLNLNKITAGKIPALGNEGLLDQMAALRWVKGNIAAFGGDPDNVTIFGESAGGMSVACLMCMPAAAGLFHKAIIESAVGAIARPLEDSVGTTEVFLKSVGSNSSDIARLRALPVEKILAAQQTVAIETGRGEAPCIPVVDGKVLPVMPLEAFAEGQTTAVPLLIGSNRDEQKFFSIMDRNAVKMDNASLLARLSNFVTAGKAPGIIEKYRQLRTAGGLAVTPYDLFSAITTDLKFRMIAQHIAACHYSNGSPVYHYLFTWESPAAHGALGSCHVLEVGFVFGTFDPRFNGQGPKAEILSRQMQSAWAAFARQGNPSNPVMGKWLQYGKARNTMIIGADCYMEKAISRDEMKIWEKAGEIDLNQAI
jgi:para-nitrobenzyl esterase